MPTLVVALVAALCLPVDARGQEPETEDPGELAIKATFLMNFARYTEWPAETFPVDTSPIVIGVLGDDPFGAHMDVLTGKSVGERPIHVRYYARAQEVDCHVLYVSSSLRRRVPEVLGVLGSRPVFTVSDLEDFASDGGVCRFVRVGDNVRFEINNDSARAVGLRISAHMLRLAVSVRGEA